LAPPENFSADALVWERSPQPPEANGVSEVETPTVCYFCYLWK